MGAQDLARGLVAGVLVDYVDDWGKNLRRIGLMVAVPALLGAVFLDGVWRALMIFVLLLALIFAACAWFAGWLAVRMVRRFAEPRHLTEHRAAIDEAIDAADLPTHPIPIMRMLWRLKRGGFSTEVVRLVTIVSELSDELG